MGPCSHDEVDYEEAAGSNFFQLFEEDEAWYLPSGDEHLKLRRLYDNNRPCDTLVVAFSSSNAHFDFDGSFSRLQAEEKLSALLVTDDEMTWFLRSTEDGGDPFGPVVKLVSDEVEYLQPKHLVTFGYCRGGYAAVRAGVALGATSIFALSPQVFIDPVERRERELPRAYFDWYLEKIKGATDTPMDSLVSVLAGECGRNTDIQVHVGAGADLDRQEVEMLEKEVQISSANHTVSIHVHAQCGHELPLDLKTSNRLYPLLMRMFVGVPEGEKPTP